MTKAKWHLFIIWVATWQNQQNNCAPSEDSDHRGGIKTFTSQSWMWPPSAAITAWHWSAWTKWICECLSIIKCSSQSLAYERQLQQCDALAGVRWHGPRFSINNYVLHFCMLWEIVCFHTVAWLFTEFDVQRGILKFQYKTWEFRATSYSVNSGAIILALRDDNHPKFQSCTIYLTNFILCTCSSGKARLYFGASTHACVRVDRSR